MKHFNPSLTVSSAVFFLPRQILWYNRNASRRSHPTELISSTIPRILFPKRVLLSYKKYLHNSMKQAVRVDWDVCDGNPPRRSPPPHSRVWIRPSPGLQTAREGSVFPSVAELLGVRLNSTRTVFIVF